MRERTAREIGRGIREKRWSAPEAAEEFLREIAGRDSQYGCFMTVDPELVLSQAAAVQRKIEKGEYTGPLAGVPIAVKDNICADGLRTTCASRMLQDFVPPYDAEAVKRMKEAGMVVLGKTNLDEFAMGSTTETSAFGSTKNPWNPEHVPGGSSGGSSAAVAAGLVPAALGSDTGGSVRQPAAFCGVTGLKPTYGTVSRYGLVAYASSLDVIGVIGRDIWDCALIWDAMAALDRKDSTSLTRSDKQMFPLSDQGLAGKKIGIPKEWLEGEADHEMAAAVESAAGIMEKLGAKIQEIRLPLTAKYAVPAYYLIACAEASSNLARFDGVKYGYRTGEYQDFHELYRKTRSEGFGSEAKRRMLLGAFVLSAGHYEDYYRKACEARKRIRGEFAGVFQDFDLILGPAAPSGAPRLGESLGRPLQMYRRDIHTVAANLAGLPAVSLPAGLAQNGLPLGIQLMAAPLAEKTLFDAAASYQKEVPALVCPCRKEA